MRPTTMRTCVLFTLVPTLRVGMPSPTLRVVFPRAAPFGWRGHSRVAAPARHREVPTAPLRWRQGPREFGRAPKTTRSVGDGIPTRSVGTSVIRLHHWKPGGVCNPSVNRCSFVGWALPTILNPLPEKRFGWWAVPTHETWDHEPDGPGGRSERVAASAPPGQWRRSVEVAPANPAVRAVKGRDAPDPRL